MNFVVTKFADINNIIIPLFNKYPLIGVKKLNFQNFCKIAELMKNKAHLTTKGLKEIKKN